ncbi:MAG TPA: Ig domain-containing protein, partial [Candidatus Acidoferrum sp.]|nr:Ig domain-containing protein [Candidatus Acidoferrum sp.]
PTITEMITVTDNPSVPDVADSELVTVMDTVKVTACQMINITPTGTLPLATVGAPYAALHFNAANAVGAVTWATAGNVPPGLSINASTGVFSGTPSPTGSANPVSFTFAVTATDSNGCPGSVSVTIIVNPAPAGATFITITSGTSNDQGIPLPGGVTLVGNSSPFTVTVTVQAPPGDPNATGTFTVVDTSNPQIICTGTLSGGTGTCPLIIAGAAPGNLSLSATYTPDTNSIDLLPSTSNPSMVQILQITPCGTLPGPQTASPGAIATFTITTCIASDVTGVTPTITVTDCPPNTNCITSLTAVAGFNGVLNGTITLTLGGTSNAIPVQGNRPRSDPWRVPIFGLGLLLAILMAVQLARQKRARPRLLYAAGILIALLLTGISGCSNSSGHFPNAIATPPNTYTIHVTITAGSNSVTVPLTLTVTQ